MSTLQTNGLSEQVTLHNLPALRKAMMTGGIVIIVSFLLAFFVQPVFIFVALLPGIGLLIAGLTGWCPSERLMQKFSKNNSAAPQNFVQ